MTPAPSTLLLRSQADARLAALSASGSEAAFATLVERHRRALYALALTLVPAADADDLVQQTLLRGWVALTEGTRVEHPKPWLLQILRHLAWRQLAQRSGSLGRLDEPAGTAAAAAAAAATDDAYAAFQTRASLRETLAQVAQLPAGQRQALIEHAVHGRGQRQIAEDLGSSEGAVRQLLFRARATLRAAATALVPWPLIARLAGAGSAGSTGAAGVGAAAKVSLAVALTGAAAGGLVAELPSRAPRSAAPPHERRAAPSPVVTPAAPAVAAAGSHRPTTAAAALAPPDSRRPAARARRTPAARPAAATATPVAARRDEGENAVSESHGGSAGQRPASAAPRPSGVAHRGPARGEPESSSADDGAPTDDGRDAPAPADAPGADDEPAEAPALDEAPIAPAPAGGRRDEQDLIGPPLDDEQD